MKKFKKGITFGVFDGLTSAHLEVLKQAKEQCEYLIVGVSDDNYVRKVKKKDPIIKYRHRKRIIKSLPFVDKVVRQRHEEEDFTFSELNSNKQSIVDWHKPDVIFVGAEYKEKNWEGKLLGLPVVYIEHNHKIHSNDI